MRSRHFHCSCSRILYAYFRLEVLISNFGFLFLSFRTLFTINKNWAQPRLPSIGSRINKPGTSLNGVLANSRKCFLIRMCGMRILSCKSFPTIFPDFNSLTFHQRWYSSIWHCLLCLNSFWTIIFHFPSACPHHLCLGNTHSLGKSCLKHYLLQAPIPFI